MTGQAVVQRTIACLRFVAIFAIGSCDEAAADRWLGPSKRCHSIDDREPSTRVDSDSMAPNGSQCS